MQSSLDDLSFGFLGFEPTAVANTRTTLMNDRIITVNSSADPTF